MGNLSNIRGEGGAKLVKAVHAWMYKNYVYEHFIDSNGEDVIVKGEIEERVETD